jgi:hypothetical protein
MQGYFLDLRHSRDEGETWLIDVIGGYMGYTAIYRYNGTDYIRKLAHNNCRLVDDFKYKMTPKEFKKLLSNTEKNSVKFLGKLH